MLTRIDTDRIRRRAAEIRKHWTPAERRRRMGLPPDAPQKLQTYLHDWPASQFSRGIRVLTV